MSGVICNPSRFVGKLSIRMGCRGLDLVRAKAALILALLWEIRATSRRKKRDASDVGEHISPEMDGVGLETGDEARRLRSLEHISSYVNYSGYTILSAR